MYTAIFDNLFTLALSQLQCNITGFVQDFYLKVPKHKCFFTDQATALLHTQV